MSTLEHCCLWSRNTFETKEENESIEIATWEIANRVCIVVTIPVLLFVFRPLQDGSGLM